MVFAHQHTSAYPTNSVALSHAIQKWQQPQQL